jgi:MerE protein
VNTPRAGGRRGATWMLGAFAVCPCHLPLTLAALTTVLGGTAAGGLLREHVVLAGVLVTGVWLLGTARGVWLLRRPKACPVPPFAAAHPQDGCDPAAAGGSENSSAARPLQDTLQR